MPILVLRCLEHLDLKDLVRPVAFLAKMVGRPRLAVELVSKGLLDPNRMKKILNQSSPREVILDVLMIISDLSRMDKVRVSKFIKLNQTHVAFYILRHISRNAAI